MKSPLYVRSSSYKYTIGPHQGYYFVTGTSAKNQGIWGIIGETVVLVLFSWSGDIETIQRYRWDEFSDHIGRNAYDELITALSDRFEMDFGLKLGVINVNRFWLEDLSVGVEDLAGSMKEFALGTATPDGISDREVEIATDEWVSDGKYVFWWEQDYYMNSLGEVESS